MDQVLVVDRDKKFLESLSIEFSKIQLFEITTTDKIDNAFQILEEKQISVLVAEIDAAADRCVDLLAHVSRKFMQTPCIVLSNQGKPWFPKTAEQRENLYYCQKPINAASLSSAIIVALSLKEEGVSHEGFRLKSFLPLVDLAKKTCCLWVFSKKYGKGFLYFEHGVLIDAKYKLFSPRQSAEIMLAWNEIEYFFSCYPPNGSSSKNLNVNVMELIGASWKKIHRAHEVKKATEKKTNPAGNGNKIHPLDKKRNTSGEKSRKPKKREDQKDPAEYSVNLDGKHCSVAEKKKKKHNREKKVLDLFFEEERAPEVMFEAVNYFESYLPFIQAVKGYKAAGIIDSELNVISGSDLEKFMGSKEDFSEEPLAVNAFSLLKNLRNIPDCKMIAAHTDAYILQAFRCGQNGCSKPFFLVGVTETDGNWIFVNKEMERIHSFLLDRSGGKGAC